MRALLDPNDARVGERRIRLEGDATSRDDPTAPGVEAFDHDARVLARHLVPRDASGHERGTPDLVLRARRRDLTLGRSSRIGEVGDDEMHVARVLADEG